MTYRSGIVTGLLLGLLLSGTGAALWWLVGTSTTGTGKTATHPAPAAVPKPLKEDQINALTLTPEAVERLALRTTPVARKSMPRSRVYGGEVTVPLGQTILIAAPLSGTLKAAGGPMLVAGHAVKLGQPLVQLLPLLTPEGRANLASAKLDADSQTKAAQTQLEATRAALDRARRVFQSEAGSKRAVEEAQVQFDLAQKSLDASIARRDLLEKVVGEVEKGTASALTITSPADGLLRNVSALPGQNVPAGGALFEVVDLRNVWVRVPVYVGDLAEVDTAASAAVGDLAMRPGQAQQQGKPALAPPSANASAGTVDLYFTLDNADGKYRPGQRIAATLGLKSEAESLVIPWSAVVHDLHGGTWVYEQTGERAYVRRRVSVRSVVGDLAVLAAGPARERKS